MRALLVVSAVAVVILLSPGRARAVCAAPSAALFPQGDRVPPNPTLYLYAPRWIDVAPLRAERPDGTPVALTTSDTSDPAAGLRVTRVLVEARDGSFTIHGGPHDVPRTFHVDPAFQMATLTKVLAPGDSEWLSNEWTCSHTLGRRITARSAGVVAAEVQWPGGGSTFVPPNERAFWAAMGGEIDPAELSLFLGHSSCVTDIVPPDRARTPVEALNILLHYADGGRGMLFGTAPRPPAPRPPDDDERMVYRTVPTVAAPRATPRDRRWIIAGAGGIGALVTVTLVLLVRRRRAVAVP